MSRELIIPTGGQNLYISLCSSIPKALNSPEPITLTWLTPNLIIKVVSRNPLYRSPYYSGIYTLRYIVRYYNALWTPDYVCLLFEKKKILQPFPNYLNTPLLDNWTTEGWKHQTIVQLSLIERIITYFALLYAFPSILPHVLSISFNSIESSNCKKKKYLIT